MGNQRAFGCFTESLLSHSVQVIDGAGCKLGAVNSQESEFCSS